MFVRYMLFWFVLMVLAILNGTLRQLVYLELLGELTAHQVSTFTGIGIFFLATWLINKRWTIPSAGKAWLIGSTWLLMTIAFEFLFGHYVMHHTWEHLFQDYNLFAGRIWILVLIGTTITPYLVFRLSQD